MAGGAFCEFNKIEQLSNITWQIVSSCKDRAKTWTANVRLTLMTSELKAKEEPPLTIVAISSAAHDKTKP